MDGALGSRGMTARVWGKRAAVGCQLQGRGRAGLYWFSLSGLSVEHVSLRMPFQGVPLWQEGAKMSLLKIHPREVCRFSSLTHLCSTCIYRIPEGASLLSPGPVTILITYLIMGQLRLQVELKLLIN